MVHWYDPHRLPVPEPTRPTAVVTLAVGPEGRDLHAVTGPFAARYAARIGADFRVIAADEPGEYPLAYKWAAARYIRAYDRLLYLDADALIRPTAPDAFAAVPAGEVGMVDEADDFRRGSPDGGKWWVEQVAALQRQMGVSPTPHPFAFNAGVYVASRCHAEAFDGPPHPVALTFCGEQHLLNERLFRLSVPVCRLGSEWNARWMWQRADAFDPWNYVVHLSGFRPHAARVEALRTEAARWA